VRRSELRLECSRQRLVLCAPARRTFAAVSATRATSRPILSAGFPSRCPPGLHRVVVARRRRGVFEAGGTLYPEPHKSVNNGAFVDSGKFLVVGCLHLRPEAESCRAGTAALDQRADAGVSVITEAELRTGASKSSRKRREVTRCTRIPRPEGRGARTAAVPAGSAGEGPLAARSSGSGSREASEERRGDPGFGGGNLRGA